MRIVYAALALLGLALPYAQLLPWLARHGPDPAAFVREAAQLPIGAFAWLDVLIGGAALLLFIALEGRRLGMPRLWLPAAAVLLGGISFGLPLFLLLRSAHLERVPRVPAVAGRASP